MVRVRVSVTGNGLDWLEFDRIMVRDVTRHRRTEHMRLLRIVNL